MLRSTLFTVLAITTLSAAAAPPGMGGRVEMPLEEWRGTLEQLRTAEDTVKKGGPGRPVAPVSGLVHSAVVQVTSDGGTGTITVDYDAESLVDGWSLLPLAGDALVVESAQASAGRVVRQGKEVALLTEGPLRAKVRLVFVLAGSEAFLPLAPALAVRMGFSTSDARRRLQAGPVTVAAGGSAAIPSQPHGIALRLLDAAVPVAADRPGEWQMRPETLVHYEDGRLNFSSRAVLWCVGGDERLAMVWLPAEAMVLEVQGEDLGSWKREEKGVLRMEWKTPGVRQRVVTLRYATEQKDVLAAWPLQAPSPKETEAVGGAWLVRNLPGLRFTVPGGRPMAATLSAWMREALGGQDAVLFAAAAGTRLPVEPLKALVLPDAGIARAEYTTRLARGGGVLTNAVLEVSHGGAVGAEFQLPPQARLVACKIGSAPASPVDLGQGRFRLDLPAAGSGTTRVQCSFAEQGPPLSPASGRVRLTLLSSPLLTDRLEWTVQLPDDLALNAFEGSVTATGGSAGLHFRQELSRETAPWVDLFYQKKLK